MTSRPRGLRTLLRDQAPALLWEVERAGAPVVVRVAIDGDLAQLASDIRAVRATGPSLAALPGSSATGLGLDPDAVAAGITKVDDSHYQITRALVEQVLANPMAAMRGARVVPSYGNGQVDGMKLYAIRPGSIYALLGFKNGDTITRVNGFPIDSMDRALEIYARVRTADRLEIEVTRTGRPVALTIEVR